MILASKCAYSVAIKRKPLPLHLEIQRHRGNPIGLIRSSFRENGKVKHSTHGRITGLTLEQLKLVQAAFRGDVVPKGSAEDFQILAYEQQGLVRVDFVGQLLDLAQTSRDLLCHGAVIENR